jgi:hypothetical protein
LRQNALSGLPLIDLYAGFYFIGNHATSFIDLVTAAEHGCDMCKAIQQASKSATNLVGDVPIRYQLMYGKEREEGPSPLNQIRFLEYSEYLRFESGQLDVDFDLYVEGACLLASRAELTCY